MKHICWDCFIRSIMQNNELLSAFFGALVGGGFTLAGTLLTDYNNNKAAKEQEKNLIKMLKHSLHTELVNLKSLLEMEFKESLESKADIFGSTCVISQDYFTVYHSNSILVGKLDEEIRNKVINVYILAKYFIDAIKGNTANICEYNKYNEMNEVDAGCNDKQKKHIYKSAVSEYDSLKHYKTNILLPTYKKIIEGIDELLPLLNGD